MILWYSQLAHFWFHCFSTKIPFARFSLLKSWWSELQWPEVKGQGSVLRKNSDCDWHASHSHLSKPFALLWPAQQGMRFPVIRGGCTNVRLESAAIPKYLWFHRKYNRNCKNQMPSCSALEPPSCARLSGGLLAATPDGQEAWNC